MESIVNSRLAPGGGVRSHLIAVPFMMQVKRTVSSGHAALVLDVKVPVKINVLSKIARSNYHSRLCQYNQTRAIG